MKNHKRLLVFLWKYTKTPMSKFVPYRNSGDMFAVLATIYSCLTLPIYLHTFLWLTLIQSKQARK